MKLSTGKIHTIMKTKNIFLTAVSALFIFAACSEEKIIDEPGISGKGDLVIELSPSSVITKAAATDAGYAYATEDELNVEDCWIFVFNGETPITSQYFSGADLLATDNNYVDNPGPNGGSQTYKKGYKVTLKGLNHGTYDFWVVANPTESNTAYGSCQSLSALKGIIEGGDTYKAAFADKADQLVKVGNKSAEFGSAATSIQIPLTQLAARVELKVRVDIPRQLIGGEYEYPDLPGSQNGVLTEKELNALYRKYYGIDMPSSERITNSDLMKEVDGKYVYTYFGHQVRNNTDKKLASVSFNKKMKVVKNTRYDGYLLDDIRLSVGDIRIKSELVPVQVVNEQLDGNIFNPIEDQISTTYLFKFYTYTKEDLTISLTGNLKKASYQVSQEGTLDNCMFVNDKNPGSLVDQINKNGIQEGEILYFSGGPGWGSEVVGVLLCNEDAWVAVGEAIEGVPKYETGTGKEYSSGSISLKPQDGFKVGNMYEASLLIQSVPTTGTLNVVIDDIKEYESEIKFEFN